MVTYPFPSAIVSVIFLFSLATAANLYSTGIPQDELQNNRYLNRLNRLKEIIKQLKIRSEKFPISTSDSINENELTGNRHPSGNKFHVPGTAYEGQDIDSWAKLQISPTAFDSVLYNDFLINIYEHSGNGRIIEKNQTSDSRKYYYAPLAIIDAWSARSFKNEITQQFEMEFSIELWNDDIQKQVTELIREKHKIKVRDTSVQIIPFKELILTSSSTIFRKKYKFTADTWVPYQQGKRAKFSLICESLERCSKIAKNMKDEPESFRSLRLQFRVDSEKSKTQKTNIRIQSIMKGNLMSKLSQEMPGAEFALLRESDTQQILSESASNIIYDSFSDSDNTVIKPTENNQLMSFLKDNIIEAQKTMIDMKNDTRWGNVFWNADNYRPDKLTHSFQEKFDSLNQTGKRDFANAFNNIDKLVIDTSVNVPAALLDVKFKTDVEHGLGEDHSKSSLDKFLKETLDKIMWDGEKFNPKPMTFSRMNLNDIKEDTKLVNTKVTIKYSTATMLVEANIPTNKEFVPPNELVKLQKLVEGIATNINSTEAELEKIELNMEKTIKETSGKVQTVDTRFKTMENQIKSLEEALTNGLAALPVFDAYRMAGFDNVGETITYDGVNVDVHSNLNSTHGIFTVPVNGYYEITFHGTSGAQSELGESTTVRLMVNGVSMTQANGAQGTPHQMALSTILPLHQHDEVSCQLYSGAIYGDNSNMFTHFTGQLLTIPAH